MYTNNDLADEMMRGAGQRLTATSESWLQLLHCCIAALLLLVWMSSEWVRGEEVALLPVIDHPVTWLSQWYTHTHTHRQTTVCAIENRTSQSTDDDLIFTAHSLIPLTNVQCSLVPHHTILCCLPTKTRTDRWTATTLSLLHSLHSRVETCSSIQYNYHLLYIPLDEYDMTYVTTLKLTNCIVWLWLCQVSVSRLRSIIQWKQ